MENPEYTTLIAWMEPPSPAPSNWYQDRGRAFEAILIGIMSRENLDPSGSFRPAGEEIDASFHHNHRTYLMEAKWRADPSRAADLYAFKGKVDGKLIGTIGVFFSMSDYSEDAVDALMAGKELNLILFGKPDILAVARGDLTLGQALDLKLRYAVQYGSPFYDLTTRTPLLRRPRRARPKPTSPRRPDMMGFEWTPDLKTRPAPIPVSRKYAILVEGALEEQALTKLFQRLEPKADLEISFKIAGGQLGLGNMARHLLQTTEGQVIVVLDDDMASQATKELDGLASNSRFRYIRVSPTFETVFEDACDVEYINAVPPTPIDAKTGRRLGNHADVDKLRQLSEPLGSLLDELFGKPAL